ncbi:MAG: Asp-tRNA(Asn)/Glu-tRNA(Gln) amidotransferase subunit GatB [Geothrix sp.]|uniref:Asp-tRNA(Asn)/Glu-tRNA(Gln) amidotransferase subunit GatB n=1 Tax=Geothrix sp. TaxID=1962974 RepID=UPI00183BE420|nr:Asp-tRNA(Asn)/Glu-tRNA(Gln) amidotransferase subunit GatB [Geothrix sp.]NWJ41245.1 Asp-tRNA(Asn)/Glu-tRNA(Gln) amidotransferase subunit GatB [Geothrix sp.]WIL20764.1 MAG: Asp-tRNA(Asn)/Glu-tRNA(Gln) amidotransferase subunit GatB [Geothrix sp.]
MKPGYEAVIGLEVHVQLRTRSKMFCACRNLTGAPPNSLTCPVCLGLPGALPALNAEAVRMALALGLAVEAEIRPRSAFYRKQYFYPDLPKGYQITQGPVALVEAGHLDIPGDARVRGAEGPVRIRIERAHLEEDAGKSHHDLEGSASHVDLNRAGVPLLEVVGAPDLRSAAEASDYLKTLHRLVVGLGICDGNLEEGSFRCDANVSIRPSGSAAFGTRVEVKNLNSFRFVRQALEHELERQMALLEGGGAVQMETRGWDAAAGETRAQRTKEAAMDYRYFPEPDLPLLAVEPAEIEAARAALPELPERRIRRWREAHGLGLDEAQTLAQSPAFAAYFEAVTSLSGSGRGAAAWMLGEVSRTLNERGTTIEAFPITPEALAGLVRLVEARTLGFGAAKDQVFPALLAGEGPAEAIVAARGLAQVSDRGAIEALVAQVLDANPGPVAQVRGGKESLKGFLVGQVLKAGQGRLDAKLVTEVLAEALAKP